jgi:transcriptional regulator with XRE-family HTH domain
VRSLFKKSDYADAPRGAPRRGPAGRTAPLHITSMAERTSGLDESLGSLIGDMRLALGMTPGELALRLGTTVDTVMTLEQGRLRALPHWEETQRIVAGLCALHRVDPRPLLQRIYEQTSPTHLGAPPERGLGALQRTGERTEARPTARKAPQPEPQPRRRSEKNASRAVESTSRPVKKKAKVRVRTRGRGRALMAVAGPMVIIAAAVWMVQAQPRALREAITVLPASLAQPMLSGLDTLSIRLAPRVDGLKWIEVADPSSRKADKLPTVAR